MFSVLNSVKECNGLEVGIGLNISNKPNLLVVAKEHLAKYTELGGIDGYIADVEIPSDAQIVNGKTNKLVIKKITDIKKHYLFTDYEWCLNAVQQSIFNLQFITNPTEDIYLVAVNANGNALKYITNQTADICMEAICANPEAIIYVKNQSLNMCLAVVVQDGLLLQYVKNQTDEICKAAIENTFHALLFVKDQTDELCYYAVQQNSLAINYIRDPVMKEIIFMSM
jgi:hypothetical protein